MINVTADSGVITYVFNGELLRHHAHPALLAVVADDLEDKGIPYTLVTGEEHD